jgi:hypothetical protein
MSENNIYKFYCEKCDYTCEFKSLYDKHILTEKHITGKRKIRCDKKDEPKKYICEKCNYNTINIYNYKTHMLNNHSSLEEKKKEFTYYCEACNYGIFNKDNYEKHLLTKKHLSRIQE